LRFVGLVSALAILVLSIIIVLVTVAGIDGVTFAKRFMDNLTLALIVLIVAIPEGIPMTIGISLAYSVIAMYEKDNLIVRDLTAPEQLGLIDEIALGKTGTMTTEEMSVVSFYIQNQNHMNSRKDSLNNCHILEDILEKIHESIVWNSSAYIEMTENSFYVPIGNGTEVSLLKWLQDAEIPVHEMMQEKADNVLFALPFDSNLKRSIVAVRHPRMENTVRIYIKGAPEVVVPKCQYHYRETGAKEPFDFDAQEYVMNDTMIEKMAKKGHRCMAFSYADVNEEDFMSQRESTANFTNEGSIEQLEFNQTFLALIALHDPLRPKIKDTLAYATLSGLNIRLISGDNLETCRALACDVGILTKEQYDTVVPADQSKYAMEAKDFRDAVGGLQE
jgi:Ca2+ transporting ATPase